MKPTQLIPPNYQPAGKFDLKNIKQVILINFVGLFMLVLTIMFFTWLLSQIRPESGNLFSFEVSSLSMLVISFAKIIFTFLFVLILHEGFHAFFFWFFSKQKPIIGFKGFYAYASMPGWYFPRNQYLLIVIAPLIFITLIGILLFAIMPAATLNLVLVALIINATGAAGDIPVAIWLLTKPPATYALDQIDTIEFFTPVK